ncbi:MAG TPA: hypothetical protein VJL59_06220 [Anaerolineales bacterium]|nr:hypothetical protein [Anaerolineales bacterium]
MPANLQQITPLTWIAVIAAIVVIAGVFYWLRRRKFSVTKLEVTAGPVKAELEPDKTPAPTAASPASSTPSPPPSTEITGNVMVGKNKIGVRRKSTRVKDNKMLGESEIEVGAKPRPKPKRKKGR